MIMPESTTLAVMISLSTSQPMSKSKEKKVTLNVEPFSTVNGYDILRLHFHGFPCRQMNSARPRRKT